MLDAVFCKHYFTAIYNLSIYNQVHTWPVLFFSFIWAHQYHLTEVSDVDRLSFNNLDDDPVPVAKVRVAVAGPVGVRARGKAAVGTRTVHSTVCGSWKHKAMEEDELQYNLLTYRIPVFWSHFYYQIYCI